MKTAEALAVALRPAGRDVPFAIFDFMWLASAHLSQ
jgi:hypothetical protein